MTEASLVAAVFAAAVFGGIAFIAGGSGIMIAGWAVGAFLFAAWAYQGSDWPM